MSFIQDVFSGIEKSLINGAVSGVISATKGPSGDIQPGDIQIESITLMSEDKQRKYNLMNQCVGIDIFESITSPVIFAELSISDAIGLYQSFPIIGEEYVAITFRTPGSPTSAKYLFRTNKITDKEVKSNNLMVTYKIQLVSPEMMRNAGRYLFRPYKKNIHDIVTDIIKEDLQTEKPVSIDSTSGIEEGIITRMEPFKAIDFLRRRAVSAEFKSSSYVFYESRDGFVFTTLERLITKGQKSIDSGKNDKTFFLDTTRNQNINDVAIRNILAYNQMSFADTISKAQEGGISNNVKSYDMITGKVKSIDYKDDGRAGFATMDQNGAATNTAGFIRKHSQATSVQRLVPISSALPSSTRPEKVSYLTAFTQNVTQNIVRILIYGDSEIRIGDMIKCTLPASLTADDAGLSRLETGNYLVTKVRHMIINTDRPQHTISLELIKGNFTETI